MRLFTHAESGQLTYTPLSLDTAKHSRYILSTSLYTKRKTTPTPTPTTTTVSAPCMHTPQWQDHTTSRTVPFQNLHDTPRRLLVQRIHLHFATAFCIRHAQKDEKVAKLRVSLAAPSEEKMIFRRICVKKSFGDYFRRLFIGRI